MKLTSKGKMMAGIIAVIFVAYIVILFMIAGFSGHSGTFWVSFVFMLIAFAALTGSGILLGRRGMLLKDWLFGLPIIRHSTVYILCEFTVSVIFMLLEHRIKWTWAFAVQFLVLAVYLVFAISCFLTKETIDGVRKRVKEGTSFIRLLQTDIEMAAEYAGDESVKTAFAELAKTVRFSDPMSVPSLFELEKDIAFHANEARQAVESGENENALALCKKITLLLSERNRKTKALK